MKRGKKQTKKDDGERAEPRNHLVNPALQPLFQFPRR
jgi:hypothetical protein